MQRSFLNELGLEKEIVDQIMKAHGATIKTYKEDISEYLSEIKELKSKTVDTQKEIDKALDAYKAEIKEQLDKSTQYDKVVEELEGLKKLEGERTYNEALDNFLKENKIEFSNSYAKKDILNRFKEKNFELKDNKFNNDAISFLNELKDSEKEAFKLEVIKENNTNNVGGTIPQEGQKHSYTPKAGGSQDVTSSMLDSIFGPKKY